MFIHIFFEIAHLDIHKKRWRQGFANDVFLRNDCSTCAVSCWPNPVSGLAHATDYDQNLVIKVARGTSMMERHEAALTKLCEIDSTAEDKQFDGYITSFLKGGMDDNVYDTTNLSDETAASQCDAEDEECIMNVMCDLWGEECEVLGTNHITAKEKEEKKQQQQQKKKEEAEKPAKSSYFSRSSPSGTFIRDPKTGKLENVDAK